MENRLLAPCAIHDTAPAGAGQAGTTIPDAIRCDQPSVTYVPAALIRHYQRRKLEPCAIPRHVMEDA